MKCEKTYFLDNWDYYSQLVKLGYFSQKGQDRWVIEQVFNHKKKGFFPDMGMGFSKKFSNTYKLERD